MRLAVPAAQVGRRGPWLMLLQGVDDLFRRKFGGPLRVRLRASRVEDIHLGWTSSNHVPTVVPTAITASRISLWSDAGMVSPVLLVGSLVEVSSEPGKLLDIREN